eukprot:14806622-Alexandrium_andersonii.AAC.1
MSASLVGSEMCIRDSSLAAPRHRAAVRVQRLVSAPVQPTHCRYFGLKGCLLYTSDAADDM